LSIETAAGVVGSLAALGGLWFAWKAADAARDSIRLSHETLELERQARRDADSDRRRAQLYRMGELVTRIFDYANRVEAQIAGSVRDLSMARAHLRHALLGFEDELPTVKTLTEGNVDPASLGIIKRQWQTAYDEIDKALKALGH
jgi:hypothetical protein